MTIVCVCHQRFCQEDVQFHHHKCIPAGQAYTLCCRKSYDKEDGGLFWRIHQMDLYQSAIWFGVMSLVSTYLVAFAYKNVKFVLKHKIALKREEAVARDMMKKLADDKKMGKKEKDERILWKKNEVADYEATTFSIFYNNALYLVLLIALSFYVLRTLNPTVNYMVSVGAAGGLLALFSTGTK